jgi:peroxiredoxin
MLPVVSRRQWDILFLAVLLCGGLFIFATREQPQQPAAAAPAAAVSAADVQTEPAPLPDHPAPDFTLDRLDGGSIALNNLKGQVVLVHIWATWCPPCRAEMPLIQSTYEQYDDQGFTVLAVNLREEAEQAAAFMQERDFTFPVLLDRDGAVSTTYRANALPSSFFVDRQGVIRAVYRGPMPRSVITSLVEQLVQEQP